MNADETNKLAELTATALVGASERVRLFSLYLDEREFGLKLQDIAAIVDQRLDRQCILPIPGFGLNRDGSLFPIEETETLTPHQVAQTIETFSAAGWHTRLFPRAAILASSIIIDSKECIYYEYLNDKPGPFHGTAIASHYNNKFESHWRTAHPASILDELYGTKLEFERSRIILDCRGCWDHILRRLVTNPELVYSLDPRKFEELIAELLIREGLRATLTPCTRDGGRDILAFQETPVGRLLYLVECKRNRADRPVDVSIVRSLYGVVMAERASAGMIVTSPYFSQDAIDFREDIKHQMSLKDYTKLQDWFRTISGTKMPNNAMHSDGNSATFHSRR